MTPRIMLQLMQMMVTVVQTLMASRMELALENLALRQQVAALKRERPRPRRQVRRRLRMAEIGWCQIGPHQRPVALAEWNLRTLGFDPTSRAIGPRRRLQ